MKRVIGLFCLVTIVCGFVVPAFAYEIPRENSRAQYFCVFGQKVSRLDGADKSDNQQVIFFDVPKTQAKPLSIDIFDPDTGGHLDNKSFKNKPWESIFQFTVYGAEDEVLEQQSFSDSRQFDMAYYRMGPFAKELGLDIGDFYRFKLVVAPIRTVIFDSADVNLFSVRVTPDDVQTFSKKIAVRLLSGEGKKMYFYPEIPAGVSKIVLANYDFDPEGAQAVVRDPLTGKEYRINASESGKWAETELNIDASASPRRIVYMIIKKKQINSNVSLWCKDGRGNVLPIYFFEAKSPVDQRLAKTVLKQAAVEAKPMKVVAARQPAVVSEKKTPPPAPVKKVERKAAASEIKPPEPSKTSNLLCNKFTFDGTASYDPNKEKLTYFWDFGDGATGVDPVVTHIYEKGGQYTVTLKVKDTSGVACDTASKTQVINVNMPPVAAFNAPESVCINEAMVFDAGASTDDTPEKLTYFWDFGDGAKADTRTVTKSYSKGGVYTVKLTVNDNSGTACSLSSIYKKISVNTPPVARTEGDIMRCVDPDKEYSIDFDAGKSSDADGDQLSYRWDFGDGQTGEGKTANHVYKQSGIYAAKLIVDDGRQTACSGAEDKFTVILNKPPVAVAGANKVSCPGAEVVFDGSKSSDADKDKLLYKWDLGDGTIIEGVSVRHAYAKPGNYRATLFVDDARQTPCSTSTSSVTVFVNTPPAASLEKVPPVCFGNKVQFDASKTSGSDIDDYRYTWDFGDGTVVEDRMKTAHEYKKGGRYTAQVTVDDKRDTPCSRSVAFTEVLVNTPPLAKVGPYFVCCVDTDSTFDASPSSDADGDRLSYLWDFGDGGSAEGVNVIHRYKKGGVYTVILKVDDNSGSGCSSSETSFKVQVNDEPVAVIKVR